MSEYKTVEIKKGGDGWGTALIVRPDENDGSSPRSPEAESIRWRNGSRL